MTIHHGKSVAWIQRDRKRHIVTLCRDVRHTKSLKKKTTTRVTPKGQGSKQSAKIRQPTNQNRDSNSQPFDKQSGALHLQWVLMGTTVCGWHTMSTAAVPRVSSIVPMCRVDWRHLFSGPKTTHDVTEILCREALGTS